MNLLFSALIAVVLSTSLWAAEIKKHPDPTASLETKLNWALQQKSNAEAYIGYSIRRWMYSDEYHMHGVYISGGSVHFGQGSRTLHELIYSPKPEETGSLRDTAISTLDQIDKPREDRKKVWKDVAILLQFDSRSTLTKLEYINMDAPASLKNKSLLWLGPTREEESTRYLIRIYARTASVELQKSLLRVISIHPAAEEVFLFLQKILLDSKELKLRKTAAIAIGNYNHDRALSLLLKVLENDPTVRKAAIAGIAELDLPAAKAVLRKFAQEHRDPQIRKEAIVFLAGDETEESLRVVERIAWTDPDDKMRKHAVAMLSSCDRGITMLIRLAENHPSPQTRKTAVLFLGESEDPRARDVLRKILSPQPNHK